MDRIFEMQDLEFEWDTEKYAVNLRKHGVKFEEAAEVFFDQFNIYGDASVAAEKRDYVVGFSFSAKRLFDSLCRTRRSDTNRFGASGNRAGRERLCRMILKKI